MDVKLEHWVGERRLWTIGLHGKCNEICMICCLPYAGHIRIDKRSWSSRSCSIENAEKRKGHTHTHRNCTNSVLQCSSNEAYGWEIRNLTLFQFLQLVTSHSKSPSTRISPASHFACSIDSQDFQGLLRFCAPPWSVRSWCIGDSNRWALAGKSTINGGF